MNKEIQKQRKKKGYFLKREGAQEEPQGEDEPTKKDESPDRYKQIIDALEEYFTPKKLGQLMHPYSTQKNESLNTNMTEIAPKSRNYSRTIQLAAKVSFVAGKDTVGEKEFIVQLLEVCQVPKETCKHLLKYLGVRDEKRKRKATREKTHAWRSKRRQDHIIKRVEDMKIEQEFAEKGMTYGEFIDRGHKRKNPDCNIESETNNNASGYKGKGSPQQQPRSTKRGCRYSEWGCKIMGHTTAQSPKCLFHPVHDMFKKLRPLACKAKKSPPKYHDLVDKYVSDNFDRINNEDKVAPKLEEVKDKVSSEDKNGIISQISAYGTTDEACPRNNDETDNTEDNAEDKVTVRYDAKFNELKMVYHPTNSDMVHTETNISDEANNNGVDSKISGGLNDTSSDMSEEEYHSCMRMVDLLES